MSGFRRQRGPGQQGWTAIQARVRSTLIERLATGPDAVITEQEADFLADHVADDLMSVWPVTPPERWVKNSRD